jgi:hypothetical protein
MDNLNEQETDLEDVPDEATNAERLNSLQRFHSIRFKILMAFTLFL